MSQVQLMALPEPPDGGGWIALERSGVDYTFTTNSSENIILNGSTVESSFSTNGTWQIRINGQARAMRVTALDYGTNMPADNPASIGFLAQGAVSNQAPDPTVEFLPSVVEQLSPPDVGFSSVDFQGAYNFFTPGNPEETYRFFIQVAGGVIPPDPGTNYRSLVYEMERGWTFDGNYIPHFLELNWLFEEDPFTYKSINKIRVHGLTKGNVNLQVKVAGMQGDVVTDYISDYMDPQFIDLPFTPMYVEGDYSSVTNYIDYSDRGIALQMRFEGRNIDITKPEPSHVLQVLALQGTPQGNGKRAN